MSALPNIAVVAPGDPLEAQAVTRLIASRHGPAYLRLGKAGEPALHSTGLTVVYGKAILLRDGRDLTLISIGGMLANTMDAANQLAVAGYSVRVMSMPFAVPLDEDAIRDAVTSTGVILTIEEHGPGGWARWWASASRAWGVQRRLCLCAWEGFRLRQRGPRNS